MLGNQQEGNKYLVMQEAGGRWGMELRIAVASLWIETLGVVWHRCYLGVLQPGPRLLLAPTLFSRRPYGRHPGTATHPSLQSLHSIFSVLVCVRASLLCQVSCRSYEWPPPFLRLLPASWGWTSSPRFLLETCPWPGCVWQLRPHVELPKPQHRFRRTMWPPGSSQLGTHTNHIQRRGKAAEVLEKQEQRALLLARHGGKSSSYSHGTRCWMTVRPTLRGRRALVSCLTALRRPPLLILPSFVAHSKVGSSILSMQVFHYVDRDFLSQPCSPAVSPAAFASFPVDHCWTQSWAPHLTCCREAQGCPTLLPHLVPAIWARRAVQCPPPPYRKPLLLISPSHMSSHVRVSENKFSWDQSERWSPTVPWLQMSTFLQLSQLVVSQ